VTARPDRSDDLRTSGDAVVRKVLASMLPLRFDPASDEHECEAAFRLRYRAVVERNMTAAEQFPEGLEQDEFDSRAIHIVGWDGERPVATCRLVLPEDGQRLPLEQDFCIELAAREQTVELGRMVIEREHRGAGHRMLIGLASRAWLCMRERGLTDVVAATPARLAQLFGTLGFAVTVLGPPRIHWGEERLPFHCDGLATLSRIQQLWAGLA
jgi:N-acyl-L-homoserine lactone synthetase